MKTFFKSVLAVAMLLISAGATAEDIPVAYNITMSPLVQASAILPFNATSGSSNIAMYTIITVPSATQGELSLDMNGTLVPVGEGMMLTADLAANLYFTPDSLYSGNVVFTYSASDESGNISNVAIYTIPVTGKPPVILPITVLDFTGTAQNKKAQLYWQTQNENNSSYFELQRSSDGNSFETIATITAKGNTTNNYQSTDDLFFYKHSVVYYRLKMVNINGSFKYSATVTINSGAAIKANIKAWPLPFTGNLNIEFYSNDAMPVKITLCNVAGSTITNLNSNAKKGTNTISLYQAQTIPAGTYLLTISNSTRAETIKVIKQ
ncbi:MAG: T9SS type A sorting domain-containing protein [Bacteroidota bacterium]